MAGEARSGALSEGYGNPTTQEYIGFIGGPHTASEGMIGKKISETFDNSNKYDTDIYDDKGFSGTGTRENNLKTNFDNGVTVEFWLKKDSFDNDQNRKRSNLRSYGTGTISSAPVLTVESFCSLTGTLNNNFILSVQSGASASPYMEDCLRSICNYTVTTLQTFGHYAFQYI